MPAPLPVRDGLGPDRLRMPAGSAGLTVARFLEGAAPDEDWDRRIAAGDVVDEHGRVVGPGTTCMPTRFVYFYREPPPEVPVPFALDVLHRDDRLVVVDKPHFLATIPRGRHVRETALVRLRRDLDLPELIPAHRLDRMTAGVLVFVIRRADRRAYQELFATGAVANEYRAVAGTRAGLEFPARVRTRIDKEHGVMTATQRDGEPNSDTTIDLIGARAGLGSYRLVPRTGRTHQLRLHMLSLGLPILGDDFYPQFRSRDPHDFAEPLQLLARRLTFTDPVTGEPHAFVSRRTLARDPLAEPVRCGRATPACDNGPS
ncbi:pseudouridine synthase [Rhodococcus rhodnii]|uniref:RNA pseudouridylate synthase n=2 Tax=Rhodococcus rhodnii TaxID=38312 RepID=R7WW76_9NOCA|nr:pseudouridine synthase [Rhodococcus rhodnii]EOM78389.1 pseudouridylate synthase [Rhodococcus rhodnii LMG 5362]TXG91213.1 pseudouridine synthase [Rhodococcus rhodnii]